MSLKKEGLHPFVIFCVVISSLGALNNGFNTSSLNIPGKALTNCPGVPFGEVTYYPRSSLPQCIPMSDWILGVATGIFAIGGLVGAMIAGYMAQKWGRRDSMIMMNITFFIGAILLSLSTEPGQFAIGRVFVGIGSGFMTVVISMYIAELSPPKYRGALGSVLQLFVTLGILIIEAIGLGLSTAIGWRIVVTITVVPAMIQMICLPFCARSPRWLIGQNRIDEARIQLMRIRYGDVEEEFSAMTASLNRRDSPDMNKTTFNSNEDKNSFDEVEIVESEVVFEGEKSLSIRQIFSIPVLAWLTLKMMIVHATAQLTGINAIMYYSTRIFETSSGENAKYVTMGTSALIVFMTVVAIALVDRLGRKILLVASAFGMCFGTILMTIALRYEISALQVVSIYIYAAFFSIGFGMIPFILTAEVYPTYAVSAASSLALAINWLCNFIVGLVFPALQSICGPYVFLIFAGISFGSGIFIVVFIPETMQKSIDELGHELGWANINLDKINTK